MLYMSLVKVMCIDRYLIRQFLVPPANLKSPPNINNINNTNIPRLVSFSPFCCTAHKKASIFTIHLDPTFTKHFKYFKLKFKIIIPNIMEKNL